MNRAIKEASVKRYHYDDDQQLRHHLDNFLAAHNFGRRLETLIPYQFICKIWQTAPQRVIVNPLHQMPGPNT